MSTIPCSRYGLVAGDFHNTGSRRKSRDKCEVQLPYAIGIEQPVGVSVNCFGTGIQPIDFIQAYVKESYDLTPRGIIKSLYLPDVDYNTISAYGHFTNPDMPWEQ